MHINFTLIKVDFYRLLIVFLFCVNYNFYILFSIILTESLQSCVLSSTVHPQISYI